MTDWFHQTAKWADHNRYVAGGLLGIGVLGVTLVACEPKAASPFTHEPVTQRQLLAQVQAYQAELDGKAKAASLTYQQTLVSLQTQATQGQVNAQAALDDIQQKKQAIALAVESLAQLTTAAAGAGYAPMIGSVVGIAGVLLGVGAAADSRRKDQVILKIKSAGASADEGEEEADPSSASAAPSAGMAAMASQA